MSAQVRVAEQGGYPHAGLSERVIGAAIEVHRTLGPGLLESVYEACLCAEFRTIGLTFQRQLPVPIAYKGLVLESPLRIDLLVDDVLVVEVKSVSEVTRVHEAQLLTYLKLANKRVGLILNFNVELLKDGVTRRVL